tara:strand:+ start:150 stop:542 length:393 start_codon:yes stop_codon:yes gene_type:complete
MQDNYIEKLKRYKDDRGDLLPLDFSTLPFHPKRFFLVANVPKNERRGEHAHYSTKQFLICLRGEIEVELFDGKNTNVHTIIEGEGIYIPEMTWDSQVFMTGDDLLIVLASTEYNKHDYISSKEKFIRLAT